MGRDEQGCAAGTGLGEPGREPQLLLPPGLVPSPLGLAAPTSPCLKPSWELLAALSAPAGPSPPQQLSEERPLLGMS